MFSYVVLGTSSKERLTEVFLEEIREIEQSQGQGGGHMLHAMLIQYCNEIDTQYILQHCNGDPELFRCIARGLLLSSLLCVCVYMCAFHTVFVLHMTCVVVKLLRM